MCVYCEADMNSTTATVANNSAAADNTTNTTPCHKIIGAGNDTAHNNKVYRSTDILFLKSIINCSDQTALNRQDAHHGYSDRPVTHDSLRLADQVRTIAEQRSYLDEAKELHALLTNKSIQGLLEVHDEVAAHIQNSLEEVKYIDGVSSGEEDEIEEDNEDVDENKEKSDSSDEIVDTFRMVGLRRKKGESLGLTVTVDESGQVIVARILSNSYIESQGLLRPGDVVIEANGNRIKTPEQLQTCIEESPEFIHLKIQPTLALCQSIQPESSKYNLPGKFYIRALFNYEPKRDSLLPCADIGLPFKSDDIIEVVCSQDPSWWQARLLGETNIGLIPSLDLEERRQCFVDREDIKKKFSCCGSGKKEKKSFTYHFRRNAEVDRADLQPYELVEKMPPFTRKSLVLVGPPGLGKKSLCKKILDSNPALFGICKAVTNRPLDVNDKDGENYCVGTEDDIMTSMDRDELLEMYEEEGYWYGLPYSSIRSIISSGKLCLITCKPETLKILHQSSELLPYVVFLGAPSLEKLSSGNHTDNNTAAHQIQSEDELAKCIEESHSIWEQYHKYFDLQLTVESFDHTYRTIKDVLSKMSAETQWVPLSWVYS